MKRFSVIAIFIATLAAVIVAAVGAAPSIGASAPSYKWNLTNPNGGQVAAFEVNGGIITVASVHLTNGCQTPFLVPDRMPFLYDLKIRTATGPIFCTQIVRDELVSFYEAGHSGVVHVRTTNGTVTRSVQRPPSSPPLP